MAMTITYGQRERRGKFTIQHGNIIMDSSYPTGGEDASAETWTAAPVVRVDIDPLQSNSTYHLWYDKTADVVYASVKATGAEVAGTTDLSAVSVPFEIIKLR